LDLFEMVAGQRMMVSYFRPGGLWRDVPEEFEPAVRGQLRLDDGDLEEFEQGLLAVGDDPDQPWFAPDAHGTAEQRTESFFKGYEGSLGACGLR
jgi:predicted metalloprotease